ncbi:flagella biosynthesis regulator Flk [Prodigiosinella aquatilis]|nr:flagella biosynthesis regulator Flk [Prodigiosinella sp. LS101]WJV52567.1 flagella biosynthesis regulator Flk [Prodigiosinella sp. LS101]WJV56921.1 flagella biosynthesis regulator Flk [Pectobacteriaceae bacterium C111]
MQPVSGPGNSLQGDKTVDTPSLKASTQGEDLPLTPAQRTTLERLIVKIMALSSSKTAEIWAGLRHDLGIRNGAEIMSTQFKAAEQVLQTRLSTAQDTLGARQLLQQLTELLPQGNNRQAVSQFIRQQFGHTVLSSLSHSQLQQVVTLLQNGKMPQASQSLQSGGLPPSGQVAPSGPLLQSGQSISPGSVVTPIPLSVATPLERPLLPAEHNSLNQLVSRLTALTGEPVAKVWLTLMNIQGLDSGDPIPAKNFQILSQFLQTQTALIQHHPAPTLATLQTVLKQPVDTQEQQMLLNYTQTHFNATPQTQLTPFQINDIVTFLFSKRLQNTQGKASSAYALSGQPLINPFIAMLPTEWRPLFGKPMALAIMGTLLVMLLLWILF